MPRIARGVQVVVELDPERGLQPAERGAVLGDQLGRRDPERCRRARVLEAMVVGAAREVQRTAALPLVPC